MKTITIEEARKIDKRKMVIVDVRTPKEFNSGHLPKAVNIDLLSKDFADKIQRLDKKKTYLVYCHLGSRCHHAAEFMDENGFKKVFSVGGNILGDW